MTRVSLMCNYVEVVILCFAFIHPKIDWQVLVLEVAGSVPRHLNTHNNTHVTNKL